MFDVFSASGLEGADDRVLSLLALSLKNSLILGCDSATSSEFRDVIRVTFFFRFTDIFIGLVFFELGKVPKTRLFRQTEGYGLPFLPITTHQYCKRQTYLWSTGLGGAPQYSCRPLPRCHLELQVHGDFHKLMDTKSYVGWTRTSIFSILWPRHGNAFHPLYPILALTFRHNIGLSLPVSILAPNLLLAFESGVGKLEGRTSQCQAFACAIAWLLIPALLSLAHLHQPVAIASVRQCFHCFHPTPRGGLRLDFGKR